MATKTHTILAADLDHQHGGIVPDSTAIPLAPMGVVGLADNESDTAERLSEDAAAPHMSNLRKTSVVMQLAGVNFTSSSVNGLVIVALPTITSDLHLSQALSFWPSSVANLATASTLLLAGALADAIGPRRVDLAGCILAAVFMLGAGAAESGSTLVALRAIQGVGLAMHLSSSVAIVSRTLSRGRSRNIGFACLGLSQPLGFSFGLVVGGVLVDSIGWRAGWYLYGGITMALSCVGLWALPKSHNEKSVREAVQFIKQNVDWVGALLASAFMTLLSYLLAYV
jgi:MFS family permease